MHPKDRAQMMAYLTRPAMANGGRIGFDNGGDAVRLKALQADYDKFGKKELNKAAKVLGFEDYSSMMGEKNRNKRNKIKKELTEFGSALPEKESRSRSRVEKRIPKEQGIQIKLLEELNTKKFFKPKEFAKANNITLTKLKEQAKRLQINIYKKRMAESRIAVGKEARDKLEWIPKDPIFSDNALDKLWKSKLIEADKDRIDELFYQAFGNPKSDTYNPKKFLAIKKNLNEYRQLNKAIKKRYPNMEFELDHPLSKSSLNNLFDATTEQLTRVNPLNKDLNRGFKDSLSQQYEKAMGDPKKGIKPNLNKKKAVEKIARDLKLNIGKISDDAINFKYGVKEFQKLNIKNEIAKSLENLQFLNKNFQDYAKKNPELFKIAGVRTQQTFTKISPSEVRGVRNIIASLGGGNCGRGFKNQGGRVSLQDGTPNVDVCFKNATNRINSGFKNATPAEAKNYTKLLNAVKGSATLGKNLLKFGIVPEALYVGADTLFRMGYGDTFKEAGLRAADFFIPSDLTQEADKLKVQRTLGDAAATNVGRVFDYRNQIAKIDNLQSQKQNLENLSDVGEFDYIGDLSQDVKNIDTRLNQAKNDLQNKFMVSEAETVAADQALEEAYDASMAKGIFAKTLKTLRDIEPVKDDPFLSDVTSPQKTQMDLNLKMFPPMQTDFMKMTDTDIINRRRQLTNLGVKDIPSSRQLIADRDKEIADMKARSLLSFPREQVFGTQGTFFGQPLAGGGIAKIAGVDSGPPPDSGPNSQGLQGLMKRVKNL